ncbi:type II toxin-antitoxin system RelE/ParE family toxin [Nevskia soli]|uniref:type II toxin-antitoxin system RelE/ParE family toxin n=1 Tax=Nevskia soli TaxID=418856 RepID=UPI0009FCF8F8|nr:type II toxin-antitoxin system RelE/ParE family toxin [Nevskia soli]
MKVVFRPEARLEALAAQNWFEKRSPGLGFDFARAVEASVAQVQRNPEGFRPIEMGCRRIALRRFPYALIYRLRGDELLIVSVFHHRRHPDHWQSRISVV